MANNTTSPNIRQYLDVSTSHITNEDRLYFEEKCKSSDNYVNLTETSTGFRVVDHEYGWFISVPHLADHDIIVGREEKDLTEDHFLSSMVEAGLSEALANLLIYADKQECRWINLDQDAGTEEGLPTFEW